MRFVPLGVLVICLFVWVPGCGTKEPKIAPEAFAHERLRAIGRAYQLATRDLKRPPASLEEIAPILRRFGEPESQLVSPNDNEKYVIVWGVDILKEFEEGRPAPLVAYEQVGSGGRRFVLRGEDVFQTTEAEFQKLMSLKR